MIGPPIEGQRLVLRDMVASDASGAYLGWMNDSGVTRFLESRFASYSERDLVSYITAMRSHADIRFLAILVRDTQRHIGNVKLGPIERPHGRADIGILIGQRECWGRGYASEAVSMVADWAFAELALSKLTAGAYANNVGSIRAFVRAGFEIEAIRQRHYRCGDELVDGVLLSMFAPEPDNGGA